MEDRIADNSLAGGEPHAAPEGKGRDLARLHHRLEGAGEAFAAWRTSGHPPLERFLAAWTASRPWMGAQDRRFLRRVLFRAAREAAVLRTGLRPRPPHRADDPLVLVAAALWMEEEQVPGPVRAALAEVLAEPPARPWGGLPADWADALARSFGLREACDLVRVLNRPAESCDLRVNTARLAREEARTILAGEGVPVAPTCHAPDGLRLEAGRDVRRHRLYREGLLEIQDESSQLVALLALPPQGGTVLDFCAGAGGKTLALAAALRGHGRIDAYEIDSVRRAELRRRLARAGVRSGAVCVLASPPADGELYDVVLVDAPCSGSGTLRRAPHLLWRPLDLAAEAQRQRAILARAAGFVRPGGRLVYATCSVFDEENRAVAASLTADDGPWRPDDPRTRLEEAGVKDVATLVAGGTLRLLPHRHGTDGMEACLWVRTGA